MRLLRKYFVNGVITVVPMAIVIWVIVQVGNWFNTLILRYGLRIGGRYIPGLGIVLTVVLITLAGALATHWLSQRIIAYVDRQMKRVPIVKSLYGIVKDTVESLVGYRQGFQKVVLVRMEDTDLEVLGFVTRSDGLPEFGPDGVGKVAVFIPLSFQMSGVSILVSADRVKPLEMTIEQGMKYALSAGLSREWPPSRHQAQRPANRNSGNVQERARPTSDTTASGADAGPSAPGPGTDV